MLRFAWIVVAALLIAPRAHGVSSRGDRPDTASTRTMIAAALASAGEGRDPWRDQIVPTMPSPIVPVRFDADGRPTLWVVRLEQRVDGARVEGAEGRVLLRRNGQDSFAVVTHRHTFVEISADAVLIEAAESLASSQAWRRAIATTHVATGASVVSAEAIIRAGHAGDRVFVRAIIASGSHDDGSFARWSVVIDPITGAVVGREKQHVCAACAAGSPPVGQIPDGVITGRVVGHATAGLRPAELAPVQLFALADVLVNLVDRGSRFADAAGRFVFGSATDPSAPAVGEPVELEATLRGRWFRVFDAMDEPLGVSEEVEPPADVVLEFNAVERGEEPEAPSTAQVNAYRHATIARNVALSINPVYPGLGETEFPITVNGDQTCNAVYTGQSLLFYRAGGGCVNSAYSSVVHHEYGHHLVRLAGSGQGQYGEGFCDSFAALIGDDPGFAYGWRGDPDVPLRTADNDFVWPCDGPAQFCGQLLSGAVWDLRHELEAAHPGRGAEVAAQLLLASVFLHIGEEIGREVAIDFLLVDDDDGDLSNGTPNYDAIARAFAPRGFTIPPLAPIAFVYPEGRPEALDPFGAAFEVELQANDASPEPGSATLFSRAACDDEFAATPLTPLGGDRYEVAFPRCAECPSRVEYYLRVTGDDGVDYFSPPDAPAVVHRGVLATSIDTVFTDDAEEDRGWSVEDSPGLIDGTWERAVPAGDGSRGDPPMDADLSGSCFVTDNAPGNSDVDVGFTTLISPSFDTTGGIAFVSYARWFSNSAGGFPFEDVMRIEVSSNDGEAWGPLEVVGPDGPEVSGGWFFKTLTLDGVIEPSPATRIRFTAEDAGNGSIVEAGVDAVSVRVFRCEAPPCDADWNGDGAVNPADIGAFLTDYGIDLLEGTLVTDLDGNGVVNPADVGRFLSIYFAGC